jgi:hypothetical protein
VNGSVALRTPETSASARLSVATVAASVAVSLEPFGAAKTTFPLRSEVPNSRSTTSRVFVDCGSPRNEPRTRSYEMNPTPIRLSATVSERRDA